MNNIRVIMAIVKKDTYLIKAKPSSTVIAIFVPFVFLILFILFALGGATVPVGMNNQDTGQYGPVMGQALQSTNTFRSIPVQSMDEGQGLIDKQKSVATIQIPSDFSEAVSSGDKVSMPVVIDNLNADFADDVRRAMSLGILNFYKQALPGTLPFTWNEVDQYPIDVGFLGYLAVSILTVAILLGGILLTSRVVVDEFERGTIKELKLAPIPKWTILAGKIIIGFRNSLISALLVLGTIFLLGVRPENWFLLFCSLVLALFVFVSIGLLIGMLVRSSYAIYPLVLGVSLPLFFISGAFGPVSWSTPAISGFARIFPVIYANTILQSSIHGFWPLDTGIGVVWIVFAVWAVACIAISAFIYPKIELKSN